MTDFERFKQAANARPQLRAPYTFVPTPQKVLLSPTKNLNLSRPVERAISGTLTINWTNETPLLVGGREDNTTPFQVGDDYMLPGASTRGLTRATLEIASFARLSFIDEFINHDRRGKQKVQSRYSLQQIISRTQPTVGEDYDFVQALFGWAPLVEARKELGKRPDQERALRSRVNFGFATADKGEMGPEKDWVATQPKPSFYPFYLRPLGGNVKHPVDYNNAGAIVAGRKRYPARAGVHELPTEGTDAMRPTLRFLNKGSTFTQTIRVHNITPVELGGLLWALTYGQIGPDDKPMDKGFRHMLGRAKAWGYGQMRVEICENNLTRVVAGGKPKLHESVKAFTDWVTGAMGQPFDEIESIRTLLNTAHAETGKALAGALRFPEASGSTKKPERILQGYVAIKKKALDNHGKSVNDVGEIGLPRYPKAP